MTQYSPAVTGILDYFSPPTDRGVGTTPPRSQSGPRGLPVISNTTANLEDRYTQLLGWEIYIPDLRKEPVKKCQPKYIVYQCDCGRHILPSVCMCKDCVTCAPHVQTRTAESLFRRFMQKTDILKLGGNQNQVCYTVFTIPPHLRDQFFDPKAIQKVRKLAWQMLKTKFGALFGVESTHPVGSETTMFNPHLNFVWTPRKGFRPYIDTELLRQEWANILGVRMVDVWHQYSVQSNQIYKWCEYVGRPFPGYSWWKGSIRWYGKYPKSKVKSEFLCGDCGCPYQRIGTIDAIIVNDYYSHGWLIGLDPPWYKNSNIVLSRGSKTHAYTGEDDGAGVLCDTGTRIPASVITQGDIFGNCRPH